MTHDPMEPLINPYIEGRLPAAERERLERAMRDDPRLRERIEQSAALHARLSGAFSGVAERGNVASSVMAAIGQPAGHRWSPRVLGWKYYASVAAAAVVLIGCTVHLIKLLPENTPAATVVPDAALADTSFGAVARAVAVVNAGNTGAAALIAATDNGEMALCHVGDTFREHTLAAIEPDAVTFAAAAGAFFNLAVKPLGEAELLKADAHMHLIAEHYPDVPLNQPTFDAITHMASFGNDTAIDVLTRISENEQDRFRTFALGILGDKQNIRSLTRLAARAADREYPHRGDVFQALAAIRSPIVMKMLRDIAGTPGDPLQWQAIEWLARHQDLAALPLLQSLAADAESRQAEIEQSRLGAAIDRILK